MTKQHTRGATIVAALLILLAPRIGEGQQLDRMRVEFPSTWSDQEAVADSTYDLTAQFDSTSYGGNHWKSGAKIGAVVGGILLAVAAPSICRLGDEFEPNCTFAPIAGLVSGAVLGGLIGALIGGVIPAD